MNRDANGLSLSVGDTVLVPFKIESLSETPDFGNVALRSVLGRSPDHAKDFLHLNRKQVIRANPGGSGLGQRQGFRGDALHVYFERRKTRSRARCSAGGSGCAPG